MPPSPGGRHSFRALYPGAGAHIRTGHGLLSDRRLPCKRLHRAGLRRGFQQVKGSDHATGLQRPVTGRACRLPSRTRHQERPGRPDSARPAGEIGQGDGAETTVFQIPGNQSHGLMTQGSNRDQEDGIHRILREHVDDGAAGSQKEPMDVGLLTHKRKLPRRQIPNARPFQSSQHIEGTHCVVVRQSPRRIRGPMMNPPWRQRPRSLHNAISIVALGIVRLEWNLPGSDQSSGGHERDERLRQWPAQRRPRGSLIGEPRIAAKSVSPRMGFQRRTCPGQPRWVACRPIRTEQGGPVITAEQLCWYGNPIPIQLQGRKAHAGLAAHSLSHRTDGDPPG